MRLSLRLDAMRSTVQDGHQSKNSTYRGALDAAQVMYRREGWRAFYNGLTPSWLGAGVAWSAYFYAYERIKGMYLSWNGGERLGTLWTTLSAAQAGAMVCVVTNPIWLIKTRLQLQQQQRPAMGGAQALSAAAAPGVAGAAPRAQSAAAAGGQQPHAAPGSGPSAGAVKTAAAASEQRGAAALRPGSVLHPAPGVGTAAPRLAASHVPYKGMVDAFVRIGKEEGIRGYYKGLGPSLVLQTCHGAIQFTVYEELKHLFGSLTLSWGPHSTAAASPRLPSTQPSNTPSTSSSAGSSDRLTSTHTPHPAAGSSRPGEDEPLPVHSMRQLTSLETSVCAVLSKLSASVFTYPSQVVRSRLQQRFDERDLVYKGSIETIVLTWRNEGLRGFYRGLGPALMRTLPQSALTLTLYEKVLQLLPASNS